MRTEKIEYAVMAYRNGKWKAFIGRYTTKEAAENALAMHKRDCDEYPEVYKRSEAYKIASRKVVTIIDEWADAE